MVGILGAVVIVTIMVAGSWCERRDINLLGMLFLCVIGYICKLALFG